MKLDCPPPLRSTVGIWRAGRPIVTRVDDQVVSNLGGAETRHYRGQPAAASGSPRWDYRLRLSAGATAASFDDSAAFGWSAVRSILHMNLDVPVDIGLDESTGFVVTRFDEASRPFDAATAGESPAVRLGMVRQVVDGVAALHRHGLVHGNLHPGVASVDGRGRVSVGDLEWVTPVGERCGFGGGVEENFADPAWRRPEATACLSGDVLSLGRWLWHIVMDFDERTAEPAVDLIAAMIDVDPRRRPSAVAVSDGLAEIERRCCVDAIRLAA